MNKEEILEHEKNYIAWLDSLHELPEDRATAPYAEGKWSPNEIVMHLAEWDRFTLKQRIPLMNEGEKLAPFPNFEAFNAEAAAHARKQTFKETLIYAKQQRQTIIEELQKIDEAEWDKVFYIGTHEVTIRGYFTDFLEHDHHHQMQILNK